MPVLSEPLIDSSPPTSTRGLSGIQSVMRYARQIHVRVVVGNATSMGATAVVTAFFGVVFWWLATRTYSPASVGLAAAAISACVLLGNFCMLGVGTLLISELSRPPRQRAELLATCLLVSGIFGAFVGAVFGIVGPGLLRDLQPLQPGFWTAALFSLFVAATTVGMVLDQFVVGMLRSELQFGRNVFYSVCRLALLAAAGAAALGDQALTIFAVWPIGNLLSLLVLGVALWVRTTSISLARPRLSLMRGLGRSALVHHALNLSIQAPSLLLPLVVTLLLSATANAYFYPAWMISGVAFVPQTALTFTLFAVAARDPQALVSRTRLTLGLSFIGGLCAIALTWLAGDTVLAIFGRNYVVQASPSLHVLILAVIPIVIKTHYVAILRIRRQVGSASAVLAGGALLEIVAAVLGASLAGLPGLTIAWLIGLSLETAYMLPTVWHTAVRPQLQGYPDATNTTPDH